jgi:hypothetical protein
MCNLLVCENKQPTLETLSPRSKVTVRHKEGHSLSMPRERPRKRRKYSGITTSEDSRQTQLTNQPPLNDEPRTPPLAQINPSKRPAQDSAENDDSTDHHVSKNPMGQTPVPAFIEKPALKDEPPLESHLKPGQHCMSPIPRPP